MTNRRGSRHITLHSQSIAIVWIVTVTPSNIVGDTALVSLDPPTQYVTLLNTATTGVDTAALTLEISRKFKERLNVITVKGQIPRGAKPQKESVSVWGPEMYFLMLVKEELQRQNIVFDGTLVVDTIPSSAILFARHLQPIDSMVVFLNKMSDNLSAENTVKILGAESYGVPGYNRTRYLVRETHSRFFRHRYNKISYGRWIGCVPL